jgi:hypothetical protein
MAQGYVNRVVCGDESRFATPINLEENHPTHTAFSRN